MTREKNTVAMAFIAVGIGLRLLLTDYPNIEPIMALSILAGYYLGGVYMVLVPLSVMGFSDFLIYGALYGGEYRLQTILGLSAFTWSGFVFASLIGRAARGRVLTVIGSVALVTAVSIPATIAYDLWTTLGGWYFIYGPLLGWTLWDSLVNLVPFALLHLISSLLFVPLFGTLFGLLQASGWLKTAYAPTRKSVEEPGPHP
ncbi:MAG: DUF6580 family putative transport protein [Thermoplasmata archaeon]